jgi:hypothetical protein
MSSPSDPNSITIMRILEGGGRRCRNGLTVEPARECERVSRRELFCRLKPGEPRRRADGSIDLRSLSLKGQERWKAELAIRRASRSRSHRGRARLSAHRLLPQAGIARLARGAATPLCRGM